ncbi:YhgE/Pip domain-containing protein [Peribacillus asahii]|uniref:YhgE/Pip domain-containing protein n=1 Tax=Peribacillus asahii TaxID=228899 RepID=A0A398AZU0_9BACI|nr:YhgE/Pip domain-containing protein [Peribacillus asahii]RID82178.1 YhgE/Pip domain-containing protein [Peribacillus asahii]
MKAIIRIFQDDLRSIYTNWAVLIVVFGLLFLPGLYAWINIEASWDPYKHTNTIPIGVVNNDRGVVFQNKKINIGKKITDALKEDQSLGWHFTSEAEAKQKVRLGEYYACIIIPENLSERITTVLTGEPVKPEIIYYVNEKSNAIAPKITSKGASGIVEQVSKSFVKTSSIMLLTVFNEIGIELERELPTIQKVKQMVYRLEDTFPEIELITEQALTDVQKVEKRMDRANAVLDNIKQVTSNGEALHKAIENYVSTTNETLQALGPNLKQNIENLLQQEMTIAAMMGTLDINNQEAVQTVLDRVSSNRNVLVAIQQMIQRLNVFAGTNLFQTEQGALERVLANQNKQIEGLRQHNLSVSELQQLAEANVGEWEGLQERFALETSPKLAKVVNQARTTMKEFEVLSKQGQNKLNEAQAMLQHTKQLVVTGSKDLALFQTQLPELKRKISEIANQMRAFDKNHDLHEIIDLLRNDIKKESDFFAEPVLLTEHKLFPIPNYGSAMSPFFTTLALWFAGLVLVSIFGVDIQDVEGTYKSYQIYVGRYLTFFCIGILQSIIISVGNIVFLHTYVVEKLWFFLFSAFIATVFGMLIYTLVALFSNGGKAVCVILLVLQISSSGGTFPVQVTPPFFQFINPYLPFTYAISLLRETVGGMVWSVVNMDAFILFLFFIITFFIGFFFKKRLLQKTAAFRQKLAQSRMTEHE